MNKLKKNLLTNILVLLVFVLFAQCKTDDLTPSNIVLYNKPLTTIQQCVYGKWKLEYTFGGLSAHKHIETHNAYMILNSNRIILGNDSTVVLNTALAWRKTDIGSNEFTYLLNYTWSGNLWGEYEIVDQIKNDTLIIRDYNVSDGFSYYYTKYK